MPDRYVTVSGRPRGAPADAPPALTFNGRRINPADQFFVLYVSPGSEDVTFEHLVVTHEDNATRTGFSLPVYVSTFNVPEPAQGIRNVRVRNSRIVGGNTFGVYVDGDPQRRVVGTLIEGNEIVDFARFGVTLESDLDNLLATVGPPGAT